MGAGAPADGRLPGAGTIIGRLRAALLLLGVPRWPLQAAAGCSDCCPPVALWGCRLVPLLPPRASTASDGCSVVRLGCVPTAELLQRLRLPLLCL